MKYTEILIRNRELGAKLKEQPKFQIRILSNITVANLKDVLEFTLRERGLNAHVDIGGFDNIIQDSTALGDVHAVVVFWEMANLVPGFHYKALSMPETQIQAVTERLQAEIGLFFANAAPAPLVLMNRFSSLAFDANPLQSGLLAGIKDRANGAMDGHLSVSRIAVDLDMLLARVGLSQSLDSRQFQATQALYTLDFMRAYASAIRPAILASAGMAKKVLVLDCDNTLWGGVLGEDGFNGILLDDSTPKGKVFTEVQYLLKGATSSGILLAICSKNNHADVDKVLIEHAGMVLREKDFAAVRINWDNKVDNIRSLAVELNVGLDSFVFVDDSEFEIGIVEQSLPSVRCVRVPENLSEYPQTMRALLADMHTPGRTSEDAKRTQMYLQQKERFAAEKAFGSVDEYLSSLGLHLTLSIGQNVPTARAAQLTQKTNQFNLTTRRYTEAQIADMQQDKSCLIASFALEDKFGDYGMTGLAIVKVDGDEAVLDSFLMSCRVIGRRVEHAFFDCLVSFLHYRNVRSLKAAFVATEKNMLVSEFYDDMGMSCVFSDADSKEYVLDLQHYKPASPAFIKVTGLEN